MYEYLSDQVGHEDHIQSMNRMLYASAGGHYKTFDTLYNAMEFAVTTQAKYL